MPSLIVPWQSISKNQNFRKLLVLPHKIKPVAALTFCIPTGTGSCVPIPTEGKVTKDNEEMHKDNQMYDRRRYHTQPVASRLESVNIHDVNTPDIEQPPINPQKS